MLLALLIAVPFKGSSQNCNSVQNGTITISEGTTVINHNQFADCNELTKVNFPNSLQEIGMTAFLRTSIESIDLSNTNVTLIKEGAFDDCDKMTTASFPATLQRIEQRAFRNTRIDVVNLSNTNVEFLGESSFGDFDHDHHENKTRANEITEFIFPQKNFSTEGGIRAIFDITIVLKMYIYEQNQAHVADDLLKSQCRSIWYSNLFYNVVYDGPCIEGKGPLYDAMKGEKDCSDYTTFNTDTITIRDCLEPQLPPTPPSPPNNNNNDNDNNGGDSTETEIFFEEQIPIVIVITLGSSLITGLIVYFVTRHYLKPSGAVAIQVKSLIF